MIMILLRLMTVTFVFFFRKRGIEVVQVSGQCFLSDAVVVIVKQN